MRWLKKSGLVVKRWKQGVRVKDKLNHLTNTNLLLEILEGVHWRKEMTSEKDTWQWPRDQHGDPGRGEPFMCSSRKYGGLGIRASGL